MSDRKKYRRRKTDAGELIERYRHLGAVHYPKEGGTMPEPDQHIDQPAIAAARCPFCREGKKLRICRITAKGTVFGETWIYCGRCSASGPHGDTPNEALAKWNDRL
jgi:hypothetical protein